MRVLVSQDHCENKKGFHDFILQMRRLRSERLSRSHGKMMVRRQRPDIWGPQILPCPAPSFTPTTPALSFPFATILPYWPDFYFFYAHILSSLQIFAYADSVLLPSCSFPSPPQPSLWNECLSVKGKRERRFWFQVSRLIWKWGMHGGVPLPPLPPGDSVPPSTPAAFGALLFSQSVISNSLRPHGL